MPEKQHTLRDVAVVRGTGAFTGKEITVEIHPAPIDHGPSFELVRDGEVHPIPAAVENIIETENRTVLAVPADPAVPANPANPDLRLNIVEHVLGALHGLGIDNAVVRVDAIELPLIDGSALPFIQAVDSVGIVEQDAPRREVIIDRPLFIDDGAVLLALPYDGLRLTYYLDHPTDIVSKRVAQIDVTPDNFRRRIGPARTFMKEEQVSELLVSGQVEHADRTQVLIVGKDSVSQPLRFADEFCYHKMLDILGDLYLSGRRLRAHVVGIRSGHHQNRLMIRKIVKECL